jgi:hypothetical protein
LISYYVGYRKLYDAKEMISDLSKRLIGKSLFTSDKLIYYKTVLSDIFSKTQSISKTGKPGRPKNPVKIIDTDLLYATVHKKRKSHKVKRVERKIVYDTEEQIKDKFNNSPNKTINTSYIERSNATLRLWDSHLTRKSYTFAKYIDFIRVKLAICISFYNFIKSYGTLIKFKDKISGNTIFKPVTAAMAYNLTDHSWTISELLSRTLVELSSEQDFVNET